MCASLRLLRFSPTPSTSPVFQQVLFHSRRLPLQGIQGYGKLCGNGKGDSPTSCEPPRQHTSIMRETLRTRAVIRSEDVVEISGRASDELVVSSRLFPQCFGNGNGGYVWFCIVSRNPEGTRQKICRASRCNKTTSINVTTQAQGSCSH